MARVKRAVNAEEATRDSRQGQWLPRAALAAIPQGQGATAPLGCLRLRPPAKDRKGDFRRLWIQRINAAARANGMTYNRFIQGLRVAGVEVDRRMLAELAVNDEKAFAALVETAKAAVPSAA